MKPIIHSRKHYNQISQSTVGQAAVVDTILFQSIEGHSTVPSHILEGANVKACYLEFWVSQDSASVVGSYTAILYVNPGNTPIVTTAQMAALHDYANKKNVLETHQGLLTPNDGGQVPIFRGWYKIPKGKQRFGLQTSLNVAIRNNNSTAIDINFCGIAVFKELT